MRSHVVTVSSILFVAGACLHASDLLPPKRPIAEVVDYYIDAKLAQAKIAPSAQADDVTLIRRLTLDLAGRIPLVSESTAFLESPYPSKRARLIDKLMSSPEYIRHSATEFDTLLRADNQSAPSLRPYLIQAMGERRSWKQMFGELLGVTSKEVPHQPQNFVLKRLADRDGLTRDVSGVFFGINISCCQCHDHPHVEALTQDYYYGLKAFFDRSFEFHGRLLDKQYSQPLKFTTNHGEERLAEFIFLTGAKVDDPTCVPDLKKAIEEEGKRIEALKTNFAKDKKFPEQAPFNPRRQLFELAFASGEQELFAKAIINRLWYRFFGYGLVHAD